MGKIFCIMGKSGTGKDTVFRRLLSDPELKLRPLVTYTTRPMRDGEKNGVEYYFIDDARLAEYEKENKVIEKREYHTVRGLWTYCTVDDGGIDLAGGSYLVIVTLQAFDSLRRHFGSETVVPVYLDIDDGLRLERALRRERRRAQPEYEEMCRRFLADNHDFSKEKLSSSGVTEVFVNDDLHRCVRRVRQAIQALA